MKVERLFVNSELKRSEVAELIGLSDRALHDCIKKMTGTGFTEYVNGFRLSYATELLIAENERQAIEAIEKNAGLKYAARMEANKAIIRIGRKSLNRIYSVLKNRKKYVLKIVQGSPSKTESV